MKILKGLSLEGVLVLLVITKLTCRDIEVSEVICYSNEEDFGKYNAITIDHANCYRRGEEGGKYFDSVCSLKMLIERKHLEVLSQVLRPETLMVLVSPFSILYPHGLWHIDQVPQCLLELWINSNNVEIAEYFLKFKLTPLILPIARTLGLLIIHEPLYIYIMKLYLEKGSRRVVNSVEWLYLDFSQYEDCIKWFKEKCIEEEDEECLKELREISKLETATKSQ